MRSKLLLVAQREYWATVRKPSFWLSTFALPLSIVVLGLISGLSSQVAEQQGNKSVLDKEINIVDHSNSVDPLLLPRNIRLHADFDTAKQLVREQKLYAAINIPIDIFNKGKVDAYVNQDNIFVADGLEKLTQSLIRESLLKKANSAELAAALTPQWQFNTIMVDSAGKETLVGLNKLIIPVAAVVIYLVLSMFATSYLLRSVSEEKENRMIEVVLSTVTPKQLVWGKVLGQLGIVFTQLITLLLLSMSAVQIVQLGLPTGIFDGIQVSIVQVFLALFFVITGFLTMAGLMVLAASAVPTYREAQSFSTVFVMISIIPIYLFGAILADPQGVLATATSFLPLTSSLVMLLRLFLIELPFWQILLAMVFNIFYVWGIFVLAFKVFAIGAMEYHRVISVKPYLYQKYTKLIHR